MNLDSDIAFVSGASRGIGQAIIQELGRRGARVIGTATSATGAEGIAAELQRLGLQGLGIRMDVNDAASIEEALKQATEQVGAPSILVNNAGVTRDNLLLRMKDEEWDSVLSTDLTAVFRLSKAVLRGMMKARHGRIISITSVVGAMGNAGQANYAAAKAGMIGFTKALAREVGSRGITVNAVAPGFIDTDMTRALNDEQRHALLASIPLNRLGVGADIAHAVAFLASREAGYITGATLHVNGGLYMA
ncbi:MAG: 3-oxoacyl-ACP reductase FabG [Gammaproteobacteria bacterium]